MANLMSHLGIPNERANYYDELDHDHGGLAAVRTVMRRRPGHYNMVDVRRKEQRGPGCSPRPQPLANRVRVGVELAGQRGW